MRVLTRRYLRRDATGRVVEDVDGMFRRVAQAIAAVDARYGADKAAVAESEERFFGLMRSLSFLPNSPTLMNAGRELGQLAACFVVPVPDSTSDIFDSIRIAALIQKTGGGTGFGFSQLRPAGDFVASTGGVASGPVSFMQVFDVATEAVKQGGTRRGANMGVLRIDHPDVLDFIAAKLDPKRMQNFNLSVAVTDAFMDALAQGSDYDLINPRTGECSGALSAARVFSLIANAAWTIGDPGLIFIDRINREHPAAHLGAIEATNPCGEQPLLAYESCTLGSINLGRFVHDGAMDWQALEVAIGDAVHFLDNVIDANQYPLPEISEATLATRKIGLGVMGWADALVAMGVAYDDPKAIELAEELAAFLDEHSVVASRKLAEHRGPFPAYEGSSWSSGGGPGMRNATTTTVAPTGTISIIAGCSSGIEPLFAVAYERNVMDGERLPEIDPQFRSRAEAAGLWSEERLSELGQRGRVRGLDWVPVELQRLFPTAHDIEAETHVRMQASFQKHVHAAVSKTINMPSEATPDDVQEAYRLAFETGCKGVTVYRDGSRSGQVLAFGASRSQADAENDERRCPECDSATQLLSRCRVCPACGWSACE